MKKLLGIIIFALLVYYLVFSSTDGVVKNKAAKQPQPNDRVMDYDIKYKDAVKDINEAVDLNLEKIKTTDKIVESSHTDSEPAETKQPE